MYMLYFVYSYLVKRVQKERPEFERMLPYDFPEYVSIFGQR